MRSYEIVFGDQNLRPSFYRHPHFVCARSEGSGETARLRPCFGNMDRSYLFVFCADSNCIHNHMGQYQLLSVLSDRLSPLNIDHSRNLPVEICGINYTEKYTNL